MKENVKALVATTKLMLKKTIVNIVYVYIEQKMFLQKQILGLQNIS